VPQSQRRDEEPLRRAAESAPREVQEVGHRAFCALVDNMERRCQSLARLRWEFTASLGGMQVRQFVEATSARLCGPPRTAALGAVNTGRMSDKREGLSNRSTFCLEHGADCVPCQLNGRTHITRSISLLSPQRMTTRVRDAATGKRYVCRLIPSQGPDEVALLLKETYRIQVGVRNIYLRFYIGRT